MNFVDPDGKAWDTVWDIANVVYDVGSAVYNHIKGDHKSARSNWNDAAIDAAAAIIPFVPAGISKLKYADEAVDAIGSLKGAEKTIKNPFGSKGKPDHQAKIRELRIKAVDELKPGDKILLERKIQIHGSNRRPDVQIVDKDEKTRKIFEVERHPESKRNKLREEEYRRLNIEFETHSLD